MEAVQTQAVVKVPRWNQFVNATIAREISTISRYYDHVVQLRPRAHDRGVLLGLIDCSKKEVIDGAAELPDYSQELETRTVVLLNGNCNHHFDIQGLLAEIKTKLSRSSRVMIVTYNPYLSGLYRLATRLGIRSGEPPTTFVTTNDFEDLARLSGFELVRHRPVASFPFKLFGLGSLLNFILPLIPGLRWFSLASIITLRPLPPYAGEKRPSFSIVIPARNEKGNIENALKRMPDFGCALEVIFVEGHSSDGTWEEILRVKEAYSGRFNIKAYRQTGKGKADAVRLGFREATGKVLTILDADLTMPPEMLPRFYNAFCDGLADFVNGTRLTYPMEGEAMRFLNRLGNVFFAKALSHVLQVRLGDSLCGTKLLLKRDYERMIAWRKDFGDFDPFGDFELLFPAAILGLGIVDVPVRYLARTYGSTNISRFRHGLMLLKMTLIGFFRVKAGKTA